MLTVRQDQIICEAGSANKGFYMIAEGSVAAQFGNHYISLGKGDVVGIFEITSDSYICTYQAQSDASLIPFAFSEGNGLMKLLEDKPDMRKFLLRALNAHIGDFFAAYAKSSASLKELHEYILSLKTRYLTMCKDMHFNPKVLPFSEDLDTLSTEEGLDFWMTGYYTDIKQIMSTMGPSVSISSAFAYGYLDRSCHDLVTVVAMINDMAEIRSTLASYLLNEDYIDFYDIYSDLFLRAQANGDETTAITALLSSMADRAKTLGHVSYNLIKARAAKLESSSVTPSSITQTGVEDALMQAKLTNSLGEILEYSGTDAENAAEFKKYLELFKELPDKESTEPDVNRIRKMLTKLYNIIYINTMKVAVERDEIPTTIKMFLNFGYVDMDTCGRDNAYALYKISENYHGHREHGIYTVLEWFKALYNCEKIPSRNEFDVDFVQHVRNLVREGKIKKEAEQEMLNSGKERVIYELDNMFTTVNKLTSGKIFTFCPILLEGTLLRSINDLLLTPGKIIETLNKINNIDYSAFYHEYIFEDTKMGVKEIVRADIRPEFILMPNVGTHGVMWQEIEGLNRRTPARMFLSAFFQDNLDKAIMRMTAEFRWEMCKRDMGARWNDVTTHSLTGDYCDYAQFFSKNRDLTADAKEKIKATLKRGKNSFKEMFIYDYILFVTYESGGSCRLNKVVRSILFKFCPLSENCRNILQNNTVFEECLQKHKIATGQVLHRMDIIDKRYTSAGKPIPEELVIQRDYISR